LEFDEVQITEDLSYNVIPVREDLSYNVIPVRHEIRQLKGKNINIVKVL